MKIQLANVWSPYKEYRAGGWFASPKMDGVRALYDAAAGTLFSRTGKPITGFEHIAEELYAICELYSLSFMDGELYSGEATFETIQGTVATKSGSKADSGIRFHAFACLPENVRRITTAKMLSILKKISHEDLEHVVIVPQVRIQDEDVLDKAREYVAAGYEGIMLRSPYEAYSEGRSDGLLKYKFFKEMDLNVMGVFEGQGKHAGRLGGLICEGDLPSGEPVFVQVGTGFTDDEREEFWRNASRLTGRKVEVRYQEVTPLKDGCHSLRFPVFSKLK